MLLGAFLDAADGRFPPVDGGVTVLPRLPGPGATLSAVVAFTGHAFVATNESPDAVMQAGADGYGQASSPRVLTLLAGADGDVGVLDATLFTRGRGPGAGPALAVRTDLDDHPRVRHARAIRRDLVVFGDERGLVTLGRGLAGRLEVSVEAVPDGHGRGWGRSLVADALHLVPEGLPVFAAVAPGNARSLRAFLGLGFTVIASEVIIAHPGPAAGPASKDHS